MPITSRLIGLHVVGSLMLSALGVVSVYAQGAPRANVVTRQAPAFDVTEATIADLQRAMAERRVTSEQLVELYLARIAAYDKKGPALNALIRLAPAARADARRLDAERRAGHLRGPLHGIPIILKDNYDTGDMPTSGGSLALANHRPREDAVVVQRLREAGAVVIAKANMHELAAGITTISSLGGQTRNPYDPRRCPGGSSGGTGAAIAASFAAVGWGSDTCGSIRIPSAFGSLVGLRPTQGLVSRTGIMPLSHTQDIGGPLARTVADLAIALDATVGADSADADTRVLAGRPTIRFADSLRTDALRGARIGILTNYFTTDADGDVVDTVRAAVRMMQRAGADTVSVTIPSLDSLLAGTSVINYEHRADMLAYLARTPGEPVRSIHDIIDEGLEHEALEARFNLADTLGTHDRAPYSKALVRQRENRARLVHLLDSLHLDALVYPTMRRRPAMIGDPQLGSTCQLSAQTGLPALTMPAGFTADGLPVGIEMLGRPFADARLVSLAYAFEQLGPRRRPPSTTPPLARGRPPAPVSFAATAGRPGSATARGHFVWNALDNSLGYDVAVRGVAVANVQAVVLRRREGDRGGRVIHRLSGPQIGVASGTVTLTAADRAALSHGTLLLTLVTADGIIADAALMAAH